MTKRILAVMMILAVMLFAAGCQDEIKNAVEKEQAPDFLKFDLSSTLICTVQDVVQNKCIAEVTEGNGNYDPETIMVISFETVTGDMDVRKDDAITFTYDYAVDVSAYSKYEGKSETYHNIPHISVAEITVIPDYIPPETVPETTAE